MYIERDITSQITQQPAWIQVLVGPRQCGKSTLLAALYQQPTNSSIHANPTKAQHSTPTEITFDDLSLRQLANRDPALFLHQFQPPLILDEVQYVPNLFPELKKQIDQLKRQRVFAEENNQSKNNIPVLFRLTGSNQILMDKQIKESLAGRAAYFYLNTLSVHEIQRTLPTTSIKDILFKGGWPELYTQPLSPVAYLNDYVRTYVEKDIILSAGIKKHGEFNTLLGLLAARTGQLIDYSNIANDCGISSVTVKQWIYLLERADLLYLLKPYHSNLNKRLIKTPKLYFLDTGLATRLQGWAEAAPLMTSPQIGALFETLVLAEIVKFIRNYRKDWELYFWRNKQGEEIDFIIKTSPQQLLALEVKCAMQGIPNIKNYPASFQTEFQLNTPLIIVTMGGEALQLSAQCQSLPIQKLHDFLLNL